MTRGAVVNIKPDARHHYRKHGTLISGVIEEISPSGSVARVRLDGVADSYVLVSDLEEATGPNGRPQAVPVGALA